MNDMVNRTGLAEILFGRHRREVLGLLLLRPDEKFFVREIARLTNVSVGSLHRELKLLTNAGILSRQPVGNQVHYQARRDCPVFQELASIFRKTTGLVGVLAEALAPMNDAIELAFVFGSVARGEEQAGSDVDLLIVGDAGFVDVVQSLSSVQQKLGREVNPVVMSKAEFQQKLRLDDHFIGRVMEEPKLYVKGSTNDLGKLTQDRATETP